MNPDTWLVIGRITGVHGLSGNLKVWSYADSPDTFAPGRKIVAVREGETVTDTLPTHVIQKASVRKKGILLALTGISSVEAAEALIGKNLLMEKKELPELESGTWYWQDLIGLRVADTRMGDIGTVDHIFPTGADDILVVIDEGSRKESLIPMNSHFVDEVDLSAGRIVTTLPEGLAS